MVYCKYNINMISLSQNIEKTINPLKNQYFNQERIMKTLKRLFSIGFAVILVSCSTNNQLNDFLPEDTSKKVTAIVKELKNNTIIYELRNNKDLNYTFSDFYIIYKLNNERNWEELSVNQNFKNILFKLKPSEFKEFELNLPENFTKNYKGIFRIRKPFVYDEKNEMENADMIFEIK